MASTIYIDGKKQNNLDMICDHDFDEDETICQYYKGRICYNCKLKFCKFSGARINNYFYCNECNPDFTTKKIKLCPGYRGPYLFQHARTLISDNLEFLSDEENI